MKILLMGDNCIDEYYYGEVKRISPEAPIPIFDFVRKEERNGMGTNVMNNLEKLGCQVTFLTTGRSRKTRLIDIKTKQHVVRIDDDPERETIQIPDKSFLDMFDCIVISDYNKGSIGYSIKELSKYFNGPIFMDTKKTQLDEFSDFFIKINDNEYDSCRSTNLDKTIITIGDKGAVFKDKLYPAFQVEVFDVCGAGDTFLSALAYKYTETNDMDKSIEFANAAASITVKHLGVYAPALEEIEEVLKSKDE
jgi:bifunctional ADP-heptose synthase (sugar kinase/adenylyltransferase)